MPRLWRRPQEKLREPEAEPPRELLASVNRDPVVGQVMVGTLTEPVNLVIPADAFA
jgi:hypothetical protein